MHLTGKKITLLAIMISCFVTAIALLSVSHQNEKANRKHFNHKLGETMAEVANMQSNYYPCCKIDYCDVCKDGSKYNSCQYMLYSKIEGYCNNGKACCIDYQWDNCDDDEDSKLVSDFDNETLHNETSGYNDPCDNYDSGCDSYRCLSCTHHHRCYSKCGNCSNPEFTLKYTITDGANISTTLSKKCGMNKEQCIGNFFRGLHNGSTIDIYYKKSIPSKIYFSKPHYHVHSGVVAGYVFGTLFMVATCIMFIIGCFVIPRNSEYQQLY